MMPDDTSSVKRVTFYSYKGGVGRTVALANAACQLAYKHGLHVIVIDWDLEAPGLHYYFGLTDKDIYNRSGLLDYLEDFTKEVEKGENGIPPDLRKYLTAPAAEIRKHIEFGSVRLITCAKANTRYPK